MARWVQRLDCAIGGACGPERGDVQGAGMVKAQAIPAHSSVFVRRAKAQNMAQTLCIGQERNGTIAPTFTAPDAVPP